MDISKISIPNDAQKEELVLPDGTKSGVILYLISTDHKTFKEADRKITLKNMRKMSDKRGNVNINVNKIDFDENDQEEIERAAACIVGWEGLTEGDADIEYSHEEAVKLLTMGGTEWIIDFITDFATERANFMTG